MPPVCFNPECSHSVLTHELSVDSSSFFVLNSKKKRLAGHASSTRLITRKYILENWFSLGSDNGEIEVTNPVLKC